MKKLFVSLLAALLALACAAGLAETPPDGTTLDAWVHEEGWTSFSAYTQVEALDSAWEAAAASFGAAVGMEDLDGSTLKALNMAACGFEDGITTLTFSGSTVTALNQAGNVVFAHAYRFVETIDAALEGATVYVYTTDDAQAGQYAFLCMSLPGVASDEGGVVTNFSLRCTESDYSALFHDGYEGVTHVLVHADTPIEDVDYTIRLVYSLGAVN